MRRFWAMLLLGIVSLPLLGPALASAPDLPACCRRDGKHHCGMGETRRSEDGPAWQSGRCPSFPSVKGLPAPSLAAVALSTASIGAPAPAHRTARPQAAPARRASFDLDRQKRGPPSSS